MRTSGGCGARRGEEHLARERVPVPVRFHPERPEARRGRALRELPLPREQRRVSAPPGPGMLQRSRSSESAEGQTHPARSLLCRRRRRRTPRPSRSRCPSRHTTWRAPCANTAAGSRSRSPPDVAHVRLEAHRKHPGRPVDRARRMATPLAPSSNTCAPPGLLAERDEERRPLKLESLGFRGRSAGPQAAQLPTPSVGRCAPSASSEARMISSSLLAAALAARGVAALPSSPYVGDERVDSARVDAL